MPSQKGLKFSEPRVNSNSNDDAPGEQRDEWAQDQKARGDQHNRQANVNGRFERRAQLGFVERGLLNCHGRILLRTEHSWAVSYRSRTALPDPSSSGIFYVPPIPIPLSLLPVHKA